MVKAMAFSRDNSVMAASSIDNIVRLWDVETGTLLRKHGVSTSLSYMRFSADASYLITNRGHISIDTRAPSSSIYASRDWLQEDGENILFLPPDYERHLAFVSGRLAVFTNSENSDAKQSVLLLDTSSKSMSVEI